jgi:glycosyltransferase involved in cell wall biosynthesis
MIREGRARAAGDRLRIVYLGHTARLSGNELALVGVLPYLADVDPYVILAEDGPLVDRLEERGIPVEILPLGERVRGLTRDRVRVSALGSVRAVQTALYAWQLAGRLRALNPALVHANTLKAWVYGAPAARVAGVPAVWHLHDRLAPEYLPGAAIRLLRALGHRFAAAIVVNSATTLATLNGLAAKATVVPPAIQQRAAVRESRSPNARFTVGMVGRLAEWKGQHVFIRAMAEAFPDDDARGVVVGAPLFGEEDYARELRSLCAHLRLEQRIDFRGFREDIDAELASFDVLVHASVLPEPFGQVVVQGMAAGLPVLASAAGGPTEIIENGVTGILYPPGDVQALAAALRRVAADLSLRDRLGSAGQERAKDFRPELVARRLTAVYRDVHARAEGGARLRSP